MTTRGKKLFRVLELSIFFGIRHVFVHEGTNPH